MPGEARQNTLRLMLFFIKIKKRLSFCWKRYRIYYYDVYSYVKPIV